MSRESVISRTQYGIYLECVSNPEATTYNCPFLLYIPESIPMEVIRESIIKTVDAHEALNGEEIQPESFTCHDINDEELNLRNSEEYDKLLEGNSKG